MSSSNRQATRDLLSLEPAAVARLLGGVELYADLSAEDLREMAKFSELPNIEGLPVHPIARPHAGPVIAEFEGLLDGLPRSFLRSLRRALGAEPHLYVRGCAGGGGPTPLTIATVTPQSAAHLAAGFHELFWAWPGAWARGADLHLIQLPEFEEQRTVYLSESRVALVLGTDDIRPGLVIAMELASREWRERRANAAGAEAPLLLPGGTFAMECAPGKTALVFSGESLPNRWEDILVENLDLCAGMESASPLLAGAEPWTAWAGGWAMPFWFNPLLPAGLCLAAEAWRRAALDPDALPFGVGVSAAGAIISDAEDDNAFVVIPRRALPAPFANSSASRRVDRLLTHKHAIDEARELWAAGFPAPELVELARK